MIKNISAKDSIELRNDIFKKKENIRKIYIDEYESISSTLIEQS